MLSSSATPLPMILPIIFGKNSRIGSGLAEFLVQNGVRFHAVSSDDCDLENRMEVADFFLKFQDIDIAAVVLAVINKEVDNSYHSFQRNLQMVRNFLDSFPRNKRNKIIYLSSVDIYGISPSLPLTEDSPAQPEDWYALAKHVNERQFLFAAEKSGIQTIILRIPGVYGSSSQENSIIANLIDRAQHNVPLEIYNDGSIVRDYLHIEDLSRLIELLITSDFHGLLNVATGKSMSLLELIRIIESELGKKGRINFTSPSNPKRNFDLRFSLGNLTAFFPDFHPCSMTAGIQKFVRKSFSQQQKASL